MDRNYIQIDGNTEDIMPLDPVADKYLSFNWNVLEIDGNDLARSSGPSTGHAPIRDPRR